MENKFHQVERRFGVDGAVPPPTPPPAPPVAPVAASPSVPIHTKVAHAPRHRRSFRGGYPYPYPYPMPYYGYPPYAELLLEYPQETEVKNKKEEKKDAKETNNKQSIITPKNIILSLVFLGAVYVTVKLAK